jgi:hypothetical protein
VFGTVVIFLCGETSSWWCGVDLLVVLTCWLYACLPGVATAQEVAEAAVLMCTKAGLMTWQSLVLDGGASCS